MPVADPAAVAVLAALAAALGHWGPGLRVKGLGFKV